MRINEEKLREFISDSGLVSRSDLDRAIDEADERTESVGNVLLEKGLLSEDDLRRTQAYVLGIPFVDLKNEQLDFDTLSLIPEPIARNHNIIAFRKKGDDGLEVAMLDTEDLAAIDFIKKKTGLKILPRLTDSDSIKHALLQYQKSLKAEFGDIIQKEASSLKTLPDEKEEELSEEDLKKSAEDLPVVRVVDTLIKHAIIQNASDIHIEPLEEKLIVRYRIDGILRDAMVLPQNALSSIVARIKVLSNLKLDEKRLPQDGRFKTEMNNEKVSFRVSTLPTYYGEKVVMRLLRDQVSGSDLESLGFQGEALERIHKAIKSTTGMILTTGPTGSGKTTTLYTVLDILNTPEVNISTVEDPVEYQMKRINQTQVKPEIGFTFSNGLRTLLRQDPDIIMVGEIRDNETAALAVNAALTGHLVLSTLHTNSAAGAVPRLTDMEVEPFLVASTVKVIIAQRLIRHLTEVKEKYTMDPEQIEQLKKNADLDKVMAYLQEQGIFEKGKKWEDVPFYKPKPSQESEDGYKGRLGVYEVLEVSPAVRELILHNASTDEIEKQAKKEGMLTMIEDGISKAVQGLTSVEEVLRVTYE
ncbi:MAG: GspE/PulE family protein [Candidatus Paceibacterota bacterium]